MKLALLIIDVQDEFISHLKGTTQRDIAVELINRTAQQFRKKGQPVYVIRHVIGEDREELQCVEELKVEEGDTSIVKKVNNSFWNTDLDQMLRDAEVDFILITGYAAEYCVAATYFGAKERGYTTALLQKAIMGATPLGAAELQKTHSTVSFPVMCYMLKQLPDIL